MQYRPHANYPTHFTYFPVFSVLRMHEPLSNVAWRQMQKQPALSCRRPTELNCLQWHLRSA